VSGGRLLSQTLWPAMAAATADNMFGFLGTIAYVVLITGMNYGVANRSFALITAVPDRVTRWFGAQGEDGREGGHVEAAVAAITKHSGSATSGLQQGVLGGAAGKKGKQRPEETLRTQNNIDANVGKAAAPKASESEGEAKGDIE
jgi:hypothetical protein